MQCNNNTYQSQASDMSWIFSHNLVLVPILLPSTYLPPYIGKKCNVETRTTYSKSSSTRADQSRMTPFCLPKFPLTIATFLGEEKRPPK